MFLISISIAYILNFMRVLRSLFSPADVGVKTDDILGLSLPHRVHRLDIHGLWFTVFVVAVSTYHFGTLMLLN